MKPALEGMSKARAQAWATSSGQDAADAEAQAQGLAFPALGYWSPEGHCFVKTAPGDCNGVFKR